MPLTLIFLPPIHPRSDMSITNRIRRLDFVGFALNIGVWVSFALAFTMAGAQWPWADPRTITTVVVFCVLVAAGALLSRIRVYMVIFNFV